jgi:hypothetical protein
VPPDLTALNAEYEHPSAVLGPATVAAFIEGYRVEQARFAQVGELEDIHTLASDYERSVTVEEEGGEGGQRTVTLDGVPVTADARVTLYGRCGSSGAGEVVATTIVRASSIVPVLWGEAAGCEISAAVGGTGATVRFDVEFAVYVPTLGTRGPSVHLLDYVVTALVADGAAGVGWAGNARQVGGENELLVADDAGETAVLSVEPTSAAIRVRARNGVFTCLTDERRCERDQPPSAFSY